MEILFYAVATAILPHFLVGWLLLRRPPSRAVWLSEALLVGAVVALFFLVGAWAFSSIYLRYILLAAFVVSAGLSLLRARAAPFHRGVQDRARLVRRIALATLSVALVASALQGRSSPRPPVELAFPMGAGTYCILQGGSNLLTNPFHTLVGSHFALDIVKLHPWGNRADSLLPRQLDDYVIFGEPRFGPCSGTIVAAMDGLCLGAGLELAISCDFMLASDVSRFGLPNIHRGIPAIVEAALLPLAIGIQGARELAYLGEFWNAATAARRGLIHRVFSVESFSAEVSRWCETLADKSPLALAAQKEIIHKWMTTDLEAAIDFSISAVMPCFSSSAQKEAMQAFLDKRPAVLEED